MKLNVDLSALWKKVIQMGAEKITMDIGEIWHESDFEFDDQLSSSGVVIELSDLESEEGLLSVRGRQVLLYIPDQGSKIESVLIDSNGGRKFHVADCKTLQQMKVRNRFERYKVTNNMSGDFEVYGSIKDGKLLEGLARLNVCQNCIKLLNYKGVNNLFYPARLQVVNSFDLIEFFTTYSSLFKRLPKQNSRNMQKGYSQDWSKISEKVRASVDYQCQNCGVSLISNKNLLHVHHKNGEKSDNSDNNLIALCSDCHRKEPFHGHMFVSHKDTQKINHLRNEQGVYSSGDWGAVKKKADPALRGVIEYSQDKGFSVPEVAYALSGVNESVVLELAWPKRKFGIVLNDPPSSEGWHILSLSEALSFFGNHK